MKLLSQVIRLCWRKKLLHGNTIFWRFLDLELGLFLHDEKDKITAIISRPWLLSDYDFDDCVGLVVS